MEDTDTEVTTGKGRKKGETIVTTRQRYFEDDKAEEEKLNGEFAPLFDGATAEEKEILRVRVIRKDPNEGTVGYIEDPSSAETEIQERWGGSTYRIEGINGIGRVVTARTIKLAGDPVFQSQSAEIQWRKSRGLPPVGQTSGNGAQPMSLQEMLMFMKELDSERQAKQAQADADRRREEREHEARMSKLQQEADDRRRKDEEERERRRRKEEDERDERRRKDELEREERRRRDLEEAEKRQQANTQQTIQMLQQANTQTLTFVRETANANKKGDNGLLEAIKIIAVIKDAFGGGGGDDEPTDFLGQLAKNGPEWLQAAGTAIGTAVREVKDGGVPLPETKNGKPRQQLAAQPAKPTQTPRMKRLAEKIRARGEDPDAVLGNVLDKIEAEIDGLPPAETKPNEAADKPAEKPKKRMQVKQRETKSGKGTAFTFRKA